MNYIPKRISIAFFLILSPFILFTLLLTTLTIFKEFQRYEIRSEIFSYVRENADHISLTTPDASQDFFYKATGLQDGGVEYGYYYTPEDDHILHGEPHRKGYRIYGIPDDKTDWYYSERICPNWFYYEIHDG